MSAGSWKWTASLVAGVCLLPAARAWAQVPVDADHPQRAVLKRYCETCHNNQLKTAGLELDRLDVERSGQRPEVWEKVVRKLRTGAMPPIGAPRPERQALDSLAGYLETDWTRLRRRNRIREALRCIV